MRTTVRRDVIAVTLFGALLGSSALWATGAQGAVKPNEPYGPASEWISASKVPEGVHPPGVDGAALLGKNEHLTVYAGDGYAKSLCVPSSKRKSDTFLNLTLRFSRNAIIPGPDRAQYLAFFTTLASRLESLCPQANIASVVHYMDQQSHPSYFDEPAINRITLQRYETGKWQIADVSGDRLYTSASDILQARRAYIELHDMEAQRAKRDARLRRIADTIKEGNLIDGLGELATPMLNQRDAADEASLEPTGVFYRGDPKRHFNYPRLVLCNKTGARLKLASAIQFVPRASGFSGGPSREFIVSGWGHLEVGECKVLRTGGSGSAFLYVAKELQDRSYKTEIYSTSGAFENYTLQQLNDPDREFRTLSSNIKFCVSYPADFQYRSEGAKGIVESCGPGAGVLTFPHFVQFPEKTMQTLDLQ